MTESVIYHQTEYWKVLLHPNQAYPVYSIVELKRESQSLSDLTVEEWMDFHAVVKTVEAAYRIPLSTSL